MTEHLAHGPHQVVAGLLVASHEVLLCHRSANRRWYPNVWDLPGGHIEEDESPPQTLVRELDEELGIAVPEPTGPAFARLQHQDFECRIWIVREWKGVPHLTSDEHDDLAWWPPDAIADLSLATEAYRPLLRDAASSGAE
jgi:8-oxo-dGTP diphosphatase